jgi:hypothetical protein
MIRNLIGSLGAIALLIAGSALAADAGGNAANKSNQQSPRKNIRFEATLVRIDSPNEKMTVGITGRDGKRLEKTLDLEKDAAVRDIHGKVAKLSDLKPGAVVRLTEDNGKVSEIEEENVATIANIDAKNETVTVRMPDESGKEVSRDFHLAANADFFGSDGNAAALDVFRAGDQVLFVEAQGKITQLSKTANDKNQTPNLTQRPGREGSPRK